MAPGSTVQTFLTLEGANAIELGRIVADETGSFSGNTVLAAPSSRQPLPIGRQVIQILGVNDDGEQTVVNMTINIAQPPPAPEALLGNGEVPALLPGQSLATRAGEPVNVTLIPRPENKQTIIDGGDWAMKVTAEGDGSAIRETPDGGVVVEFTRDQSASVSGSGFMPLTRADVWLFSEPTLLGTVDVDENGEFNGTVNVDARLVAVGEHTLQLQGVGEDGYTRSANLGVVVKDAEGAAATTDAIGLKWMWWLLALVVLVVAVVGVLAWRGRRVTP